MSALKPAFFSAITFILFSAACALDTHAQESDLSPVVSRTEWAADDTIVRAPEAYAWPSGIILVPFKLPETFITDQKGIQELYYYLTTRSEFGDMPFHMVVDANGTVYEGNKAGKEGSIQLTGQKEAVLVAYLYSSSDQEGISVLAYPSLVEVFTDIANTYAIAPETITVQEFTYSISAEGKLESAQLQAGASTWLASLSPIIEEVKAGYVPLTPSYDVEILEATAPESALEPTKTAEVKLKIKNTGQSNIYASLTKPFYITRNNPYDERSLFFNTETWDSPSRIVLLAEGERLATGEEKEVTIELYVPLYPPSVTEDFIIVAPNGTKLENSKFSLSINIKTTDQKIIEILDTPVGYLNVRQTPGLGEVVTKVSPKERFIVLDSQSGYYKIEANGKQGWVVAQYVKVIQ